MVGTGPHRNAAVHLAAHCHGDVGDRRCELDPVVLRKSWKETGTIGLIAFFAPFLGWAAAAHWLLHWTVDASWLARIASSTTSVAVVYAVMLGFGLNKTGY